MKSKECLGFQAMMFREEAWLTSDASVHPMGVPPHQTCHTMSLWMSVCAQVPSHSGTVKSLSQTVAKTLEAYNLYAVALTLNLYRY